MEADCESEAATEPSADDAIAIEQRNLETEDDLFSLDAKIVGLWRLENAASFGVIFVVSLLVGGLLWALTPVPKLVIALVWVLTLSLLAAGTLWWPRRYFASWSYRIEPRTLEMRHGIYWQVSVLIPLSRVQHVDIHQNPFERRRGLASLHVHTAGTRDASHKLPGLNADLARKLRDQLLSSANLRLS